VTVKPRAPFPTHDPPPAVVSSVPSISEENRAAAPRPDASVPGGSPAPSGAPTSSLEPGSGQLPGTDVMKPPDAGGASRPDGNPGHVDGSAGEAVSESRGLGGRAVPEQGCPTPLRFERVDRGTGEAEVVDLPCKKKGCSFCGPRLYGSHVRHFAEQLGSART